MSDWKEDAAKRRDIRQESTEELIPYIGKKKNTKQWCKGKVGVEHEFETVLSRRHNYRGRLPEDQVKEVKCKKCGKVKEIIWGKRLSDMFNYEKPKPEPQVFTCPVCGSENMREEGNILSCVDCGGKNGYSTNGEDKTNSC